MYSVLIMGLGVELELNRVREFMLEACVAGKWVEIRGGPEVKPPGIDEMEGVLKTATGTSSGKQV